MDNNLLKDKIIELEKLSRTMAEHSENHKLTKFFAGKLSLLSKEISSILSNKT